MLEHYRYPRNCRVLEKADAVSQILNPSCGDRVALQLLIKDERIAQLGFQGSGCVISQASASILTDFCVQKTLSSLEALTTNDMLALIGIPLGPTRMRCALLSLEALHDALAQFRIKNHA